MSEQVQQKRPPSPGGTGEQEEFVKVDPGADEAEKLVKKIKEAQVVKPRQPRRACCCC
jgi:hypothetical protein